ncbi:MAG: hypothetical protein LBR64_01830 [Dysgonamonadaceae bacterium]|jgi:hypothetical protein|nr:hypothetical protein [Dysgonamonadaceae bacterium]
MKRILFVIAVLLPIANLFAQTKNIDVDGVKFRYSYRCVPAKPLDPPIFNWWGKATVNSSIRNIDSEELAEKIIVRGQQKAEAEADAKMIVTVRANNVIVEDRRVNTVTNTSKDKDGKETKTYSYYVSATYSMEGSYVIKFNNEELVQENCNPKGNWSTSSYSSYDAAAKYWNDNKEGIIAGWQRELSLKIAEYASNKASLEYGFPTFTENEEIKTMDEKKHDENITMRANVETLKRALSAADGNNPVNPDSIAPLIEYFKSIPAKYADPKLKADDKLRYIANYNLCVIYFTLDQPEMITEYATAISAGDNGRKDGEKLLKEAEKRKAYLDRTGLKTRHFLPANYPALIKGEAVTTTGHIDTTDIPEETTEEP